jgi:excinuclease UvrABC nuclease subunit
MRENGDLFVMDGFIDASCVMDSGVYMLLAKGRVVYIGQAQSMLLRLYTHYHAKRTHGKRPNKKWMGFDEIYIKPCGVHELDGLEQELILRYSPKYNIQHRSSIPFDMRALIDSILVQPKVHPTIGPILRRI